MDVSSKMIQYHTKVFAKGFPDPLQQTVLNNNL